MNPDIYLRFAVQTLICILVGPVCGFLIALAAYGLADLLTGRRVRWAG